jgi:hypothetical protein
MRRVYTPRDAERLLLDPKRIRHACDYLTNKAFHHARATTTDFAGLRLIDAVYRPDAIDEAAARLRTDVHALMRGQSLNLAPLKEAPVPKPDGRTRRVHIPTYYTRCVTNHISAVLVDTSTPLLRSHVRAYLPAKRDPVHGAVLDLATAIANEGFRFWAKLDISNFFHEISHGLIESALDHYGYPSSFKGAVLSIARAPTWKKLANHAWGPVINSKGVPMGLAASAGVANLVCHELDDILHGRRNRIRVIRYADDIVVMARTMEDVTGAVRQAQKWATRNGLRLKGVSPDQRARTLVHDIHTEPLEALGFLIDSRGEVHIPAAKLEAKEREIAEAVGRLAQSPGWFDAKSTYDTSGVRTLGTDMMDALDIKEIISGAYRHWHKAASEGADAFLRHAWARHPELLNASSSTIWIASLGDPGADGDGGLHSSADTDATIPGQSTPMSMPLRGRNRARTSRPVHVRQAFAGGPDDDWNGIGRIGANDHLGVGSMELSMDVITRGTGIHPDADPKGSDVGVGPVRVTDRGDSMGISTHPGRDEDRNLGSYSSIGDTPVEIERSNGSDGPVFQIDPWSPSGATDTDGMGPPHPRCFANFRIHAKRVNPRSGGSGAIVLTESRMAAEEVPYANVPAEVALVRELRRRIGLEVSRGRNKLTVEVDQWLPKHLLQNGRHFHSVALFREVLRLHDEVRHARAYVRLVGRTPRANLIK